MIFTVKPSTPFIKSKQTSLFIQTCKPCFKPSFLICLMGSRIKYYNVVVVKSPVPGGVMLNHSVQEFVELFPLPDSRQQEFLKEFNTWNCTSIFPGVQTIKYLNIEKGAGLTIRKSTESAQKVYFIALGPTRNSLGPVCQGRIVTLMGNLKDNPKPWVYYGLTIVSS